MEIFRAYFQDSWTTEELGVFVSEQKAEEKIQNEIDYMKTQSYHNKKYRHNYWIDTINLNQDVIDYIVNLQKGNKNVE